MKSRHELHEFSGFSEADGSRVSICNVPRRPGRPSGRVMRREDSSDVSGSFINLRVFSVQCSVFSVQLLCLEKNQTKRWRQKIIALKPQRHRATEKNRIHSKVFLCVSVVKNAFIILLSF